MKSLLSAALVLLLVNGSFAADHRWRKRVL